jgi:hypothetical protein
VTARKHGAPCDHPAQEEPERDLGKKTQQDTLQVKGRTCFEFVHPKDYAIEVWCGFDRRALNHSAIMKIGQVDRGLKLLCEVNSLVAVSDRVCHFVQDLRRTNSVMENLEASEVCFISRRHEYLT